MFRGRRRILGIAGSCLLLAVAAAADDASETKVTAELQVERIEAKSAIVALRAIAGIREIEVRDLHTLSIHDTPAKLLLARQVLELVDYSKTPIHLQRVRELDDGTTLASYALREAPAREAMRMLMGKIGIRQVAAIEDNETVLFRDTAEQVKAALDLLDEFDHAAADPAPAPK